MGHPVQLRNGNPGFDKGFLAGPYGGLALGGSKETEVWKVILKDPAKLTRLFPHGEFSIINV
jgi:hypothetical protein